MNVQRTDKALNFGPDHIKFPVDVEIINEEGEKLASLIDGEMSFYDLSGKTTHGAISGIKLLRQLKPVNIHMNLRNEETDSDVSSGKPMLTVTAAFAKEKFSDKITKGFPVKTDKNRL